MDLVSKHLKEFFGEDGAIESAAPAIVEKCMYTVIIIFAKQVIQFP